MFLARAHVASQPEMIQDLVPAARERFGDAQACLANGSPTGSVYLAGYCVEMTLKHAALRAFGVRPHEFVWGALAPARARLTQWLGPVDHEAYHSLEFWALLVRETFRNRPGNVPGMVQTAARRAAVLTSTKAGASPSATTMR